MAIPSISTPDILSNSSTKTDNQTFNYKLEGLGVQYQVWFGGDLSHEPTYLKHNVGGCNVVFVTSIMKEAIDKCIEMQSKFAFCTYAVHRIDVSKLVWATQLIAQEDQ